MSDKGYVYTHPDFTISYNFWSYGGNVSFVIKNHSDKDIYLLKDQCFFIQNGWAQDYYRNRTYIVSTASSSSVSQTSGASINANASAQLSGELNGFAKLMINSPTSNINYSNATAGISYGASQMAAGTLSHSSQSGYSIETQEQKTICIPAHSSKHFSEFSIMTTPYRECGFARDPEEKEGTIWSFSSALDSPNAFENRLVLKINETIVPIVNTFHISQFTNVREDYSYINEYKKDCNDKIISWTKDVKIDKLYAPNRFHTTYRCQIGIDNDRISKQNRQATDTTSLSHNIKKIVYKGVECIIAKNDDNKLTLAAIGEIKKNRIEAIDYCKSLGEGWRLPSKEELIKFRETDAVNPQLGYWTSTEYDKQAEVFYPLNKASFNVNKTKEYYLLPVIDVDINDIK